MTPRAPTPHGRLLVVDDDPLTLRLAKRLLEPMGVPVEVARSTPEALEHLELGTFALVLTDLRMGDAGGEVLLAAIRRRWPTLPVVIMTSHGSIETAVDLMSRGATDFLTKPLEPAVLLPRIRRALAFADLEAEVVDLRRHRREAEGAGGLSRPIVGTSPAIRRLLERLPLAAHSDASVLIHGESGTGKELVARALHELSPRHARPFVPVNCGALPESLMESELFGHVKGAFTDARTDKTGLIAEADGGTLFLDEIGDLPLPVQVKLLRFLQEREIRPVGSVRSQTVDTRVIAATHHELPAAVALGTFRQDLFYRLNVVPLTLPALRERREDIPLLAVHLLQLATRGTSRTGVHLAPDALSALAAHHWPGNVRELENVLRRALVFARGPALTAADLEFDPVAGVRRSEPSMDAVDLNTPLPDAKQALIERFERQYVEQMLVATGGNLSEAARRAGKDRKSFWELAQRYMLDPERYRGQGPTGTPR